MSLRTRLAGAVAANSFGYAVSILLQLGSVPLLLGAWGPALYGEFLLGSAIAAYLGMSDLGLTAALGNDMAMATARGDVARARAGFQAIGLAMLALGPLVFAPLALLAWVLPIGSFVGLEKIAGGALAALMGLLLARIWLGQLLQVLHAGFRCAGDFALGSTLASSLRLIEFAALAVAVLLGGGPLSGAAAMVAARLLGTAIIGLLLRRRVPWLGFRCAGSRWPVARQLLRPGLMFMALPLAAGLNLQGPLLVIGAVLGPQAVVAFATARTISRAVQQLLDIVSASIWPELSRAYACGDRPLLRLLLRGAVATSLWLGLTGLAALALGGAWVYRVWTHGLIPFDPLLFDLLLLVMLGNVAWYTASTALGATNRHGGLALVYLLVNLAAGPLCWFLVCTAGLHGAAAGLMLVELVLAAYVVPTTLRLVGGRLGGLAQWTERPAALGRRLRGVQSHP